MSDVKSYIYTPEPFLAIEIQHHNSRKIRKFLEGLTELQITSALMGRVGDFIVRDDTHHRILNREYFLKTFKEVEDSTKTPEYNTYLEHAKYELALIGTDPIDSDDILKCVEILSEGYSHAHTESLVDKLTKLLNFRQLSQLTDDPNEWRQIEDHIWKSTRNYRCLSKDEGKTWYYRDAPNIVYRSSTVVKE